MHAILQNSDPMQSTGRFVSASCIGNYFCRSTGGHIRKSDGRFCKSQQKKGAAWCVLRMVSMVHCGGLMSLPCDVT